MKVARVFIQEYTGKSIGDIHDVFSPENHPGSILGGIIKEVEVTDNFDASTMKGVVAEDGSVTFEEDTVKIVAKLDKSREDKLSELRKQREPKLQRVDQLVNIAVLDAWSASDKAELKTYRLALLNMTDTYKVDMSLLDDLDISNIEFPIEPSPE